MGHIYRRAEAVLAWLGPVPKNDRDLGWFEDHRHELQNEIKEWVSSFKLVDLEISKEAQQLLLILATRTYW